MKIKKNLFRGTYSITDLDRYDISAIVASMSVLIEELDNQLELSQSEELLFSRRQFLAKAKSIFYKISTFRDRLL